MIHEQLEPVLIEDVERVRAARHHQLTEADAGGRDAMHPRLVEYPKLVLSEAVEPLTAEVRAVQVQLLERAEEEVLREADAVLGVVGPWGLECAGEAPWPGRGAAGPQRRGRQAVAGALPFVREAGAVGDRRRRQHERVTRGGVMHVGIEPEDILHADFLKLSELPPEVAADVERPGQHALALALAPAAVDAVAARHGNREEV